VTQRLLEANPDDLDAYLVTGPFTTAAGYRPPVRPPRRPALLALLHDLGGGPATVADYHDRCERLRQYDRLLTISEVVRQDVLTALGMPPRRVSNVTLAARPGHFAPAATPELPECLHTLGVRRPFVLTVAGPDLCRSQEGLVRAFARLAAPVRRAHQLVVAC